MKLRRPVTIITAALTAVQSLAGCVGYDGSADGVSAPAQVLGVTEREEAAIREALGRAPMDAKEFVGHEDSLDSSVGKLMEANEIGFRDLQDFAAKRKAQEIGGSCAGDINCKSLHCNQAGKCVDLANFKDDGVSCTTSFECKGNVCTNGRCLTASSDSNNSQDRQETDVDCGGPNSAYSCPLNAKCAEDDDCVVGRCKRTSGTGIWAALPGTCEVFRSPAVDIGRVWPGPLLIRPAFGGDWYPKEVHLPRRCTGAACANSGSEPSIVAQWQKVAAAPWVRDETGFPVAPFRTKSVQHDTCVAHLLANGCSSIAVRITTHRASYDLIVCPASARSAIGITQNESSSRSESDASRFGDEASRGQRPPSDDPFLCNQRFTHAVRFLSKSVSSVDGASAYAGASSVDAGRGDLSDASAIDGAAAAPAPLPGGYGGFAASVTVGGSTFFGVSSSLDYRERDEWFGQLERVLLLNAACAQGRVKVVDTLYGGRPTKSSGLQLPSSTCDAVAPWVNTPFNVFAMPAGFAADEVAFVKSRLPWWNAYDIYSIDPEGNPNRPSNKNMQIGYDAAHPKATFQDYASGYGVTLVKTDQNYPYGGQTLTVYGTPGANGAAPQPYQVTP